MVSREAILQDESYVICDLLLGQFAFSWTENSISLFLFLLLLLFSLLGFASNFSADDPMQKWI